TNGLPETMDLRGRYGRQYRFRDIVNVLLPVATYFGVVEGMLACFDRKMEEETLHKHETFGGTAVGALVKALRANDWVPVTLDQIEDCVPGNRDDKGTKHFVEPDGTSHRITNKFLGANFRRMGFALKSGHDRKGDWTTVMTKAKVAVALLRSLADEYGVECAMPET